MNFEDRLYKPKWIGQDFPMLSYIGPAPRPPDPDKLTVTQTRTFSITPFTITGPTLEDVTYAAMRKIIYQQEAQLLGLFMDEPLPPGTEAEHLTSDDMIEKAWKMVRNVMPKRLTKIREAYLGARTLAVVFWSDGTINHVTSTADALLWELEGVDPQLAYDLRDEWCEYQLETRRKASEARKEHDG